MEPFTDGLREDDADSSHQMAGGNSRRGIEEHLLDEKPSSEVNGAVRGALVEESKGEKSNIGSHSRGNHSCVHSLSEGPQFRRMLNDKVCVHKGVRLRQRGVQVVLRRLQKMGI